MSSFEIIAQAIFEELGFTVKSYKNKSIIDSINTLYCQYPFYNMRIDFALPFSKIAIEIDGDYWHGNLLNQFKTHQIVAKMNDNKKATLLKQQGWSLLKINSYMLNVKTIDKCLLKLLKF